MGATAAFGSTLAACGGPASTNKTGSATDSLTAVIGYGNNQSWDPLQTASAFSMAAILHSYESLVEGDPVTRAPFAGLATALPADVSGTSIKFDLREGAKWHDGQPVTADDVVFTYARALDPKENVLIHSFFATWLQEVRKTGQNSVEFVLKSPFPYALQRIQICKIMPKHVFENNWPLAAGGKVVGSGPYKVTQAPLSHTSFEKFADYNGPRPAAYAKMLWKSIVDSAPVTPMVQGSLLRVGDRLLFASPSDTDRRRWMMIRSSYDNGRTWEDAEQGTRITNNWSGYSDLVHLSDPGLPTPRSD
ncbi:MAG TPA: ABC transporter substrate-binding protein [Amycolatopsis sp.]|nr:ABC transporter substrate-binding protein [Amycolatopsis sp.]